MQGQDKFLYTSLSIGFIIVAIIFFYEDYGPLLGWDTSRLPSQRIEQDGGDLPPVRDSDEAAPAPGTESGLQPDAGTHVVESGETAYRIALKYGMTVQELIALNPQKIKDTGRKSDDGEPIYQILEGEELLVKKKESTLLTPPTSPPPPPSSSKAIEAAGDFIAQVDDKCSESYCPYTRSELLQHKKALEELSDNNVAKTLLAQLNKILGTYYSNGLRKDEYKLVEHSYRNGESIHDIAKKYDVDPREIERYNRNTVKPKMTNGRPVIDPNGVAQYEIEPKSKLIIFQKIEK